MCDRTGVDDRISDPTLGDAKAFALLSGASDDWVSWEERDTIAVVLGCAMAVDSDPVELDAIVSGEEAETAAPVLGCISLDLNAAELGRSTGWDSCEVSDSAASVLDCRTAFDSNFVESGATSG